MSCLAELEVLALTAIVETLVLAAFERSSIRGR
jgi:hypothetical protein